MSKKRKKKGSQPVKRKNKGFKYVMRRILGLLTFLCFISAIYEIGYYWYRDRWVVKHWGTDDFPSYTGKVVSVKDILDVDDDMYGYSITMDNGKKYIVLAAYTSGDEQAKENGWADSQLFHPNALKAGSVVTIQYIKDEDRPILPMIRLNEFNRVVSVFDNRHVYLDPILTYEICSAHATPEGVTLVVILAVISLPYALYGLVVILCWIYDIRDKREHAKKVRLRAERLAAQKEKSDS